MPIQLATYDLSRRRLFEVVEDWTAFESNLLVAHVSEGFITWSSIAKHMLTQSWHKTQPTRIGTFPVFSAGVNPRSGSSQPTCSCQAPSQNSARSISGCPASLYAVHVLEAAASPTAMPAKGASSLHAVQLQLSQSYQKLPYVFRRNKKCIISSRRRN